MRLILSSLAILFAHVSFAQSAYWQQRVEYTMDIHLDVRSHLVKGSQHIVYFNNSPDTLRKVYFHLYFNAFQPGSMMDVRSRNLPDPDRRVQDRISKLTDSEIGYQHVVSLKQDGKDVSMLVNGTVLEVTLAAPILPKGKTVFDSRFESQVPMQIRRSGRDNREGIAFTMTQWYPKLAEYDYMGWHTNQYVAREFHGVWGDFDVKINLDPGYMVAGTGRLINPEQVGYGYEKSGTPVKRPNGDLLWHFVAKNVIDFAWAADPDYTHDVAQVPNGPEVHFFYQKNEKTTETWRRMRDLGPKVFEYLNEHFGKYPFDTYSVIQGGDGGMEYPMCTMILGEGSFAGVFGTMAHEVAHSWFQMTLATNESLYPWMDEGFTDFASSEAEAAIFGENNPHDGSYNAYFSLVQSGLQEPLSMHADHYNTNRAYGTSAYSMGSIFLNQLKYLIGTQNFQKGMLVYYNTWKMKHPTPNDFIRVMEKTSGLQLQWYLRYWIQTTRRIDYGISNLTESEGSSYLTLARIGDFPMPVDLEISYKDGTHELIYISMNELMGNKPVESPAVPRTVLQPWPWVNPTYTLKLSQKLSQIAKIEIDPTRRMADINRKNNVLLPEDLLHPYEPSTR
ncbi:MAG: M1 family metallopeptidase [Cyclobacteriaceae bacterium]|nr:M1 family metallopeptidase [Cyclobacteriaceae bacterium]